MVVRKMTSIKLDGRTLSPSEIMLVASGTDVEISPDSILGINQSRRVVEDILLSGETVYGINTGFGSLVSENISPEDLVQLQLNLIRSHACAVGEKMSKYDTRAMMCVRANSLIKGHSGIQLSVINQIITYLNNDIIPVVPRIGSLGASGDLAPLSHMALTLIGEGFVWNGDEITETKTLLKDKGLIGVELGAKDGLSLINGTSQMCAFLVRSLKILRNLIPMADIIAATSMDARKCSLTPMNPLIHEARPHAGQQLVAKRISKILENSQILTGHKNCHRVQDPYSFRCIPQVHGAVNERFQQLESVISIEINSATDNPLIFPNNALALKDQVMSQGNFHGEILGITADGMSHAIFELGSISERRIDQLVDPAKSELPAYLARDSGLESGMMIVHYTAAALLAEMHGHAMPKSAFSTTTSGGQEDYVSMGATAAWNLLQSSEKLASLLACELIIACEGLEYSEESSSEIVTSLYKQVRKVCSKLSGDRSLSREIEAVADELMEGNWLSRIEVEFGSLPK